MTEDKMSFWTLLGQARESAQAGETSVAALILNELRDTCRTGDATLDRIIRAQRGQEGAGLIPPAYFRFGPAADLS